MSAENFAELASNKSHTSAEFDVLKTAAQVEHDGRDLLHTTADSSLSHTIQDRLRETISQLSPAEQTLLVQQIRKDNDKANSLPSFDITMTNDERILGFTVTAARLDLTANHKVEGVHITDVPLEEIPGYQFLPPGAD